MWQGAQHIAVEEREDPRFDQGWALMRVELTGLCGTDLAIIAGLHERARPPLILGHEMVGTVETVAGDGPPPGTRVAVNPLMSCGRCWPCQHDLAHTCRQLKLLGIDRDGSLADFVAVPVPAMVPMDPSTRPQLAALVEPLAVALHAVRQGAVRPDTSTMIFGGGPIGILTGLVAQAAGADPVMLVEPNAERRAIAEAAGFLTVKASGPDIVEAVLDLTGGVGADTTFDTAGHSSVPPLVSAVTRVHGTIVVAGLHHQLASGDLHSLTFAEQKLVGSRVYTQDDFRHAVATVDLDTLHLRRLPIRILPLEQAPEAFAYASAHPEVVKVMLASPSGGNSRWAAQTSTGAA